MNARKSYWKILMDEPGIPIASILTMIGFAAGAKGENSVAHGLVGAAIMSVFWAPVLLSALDRYRSGKRVIDK